MMPQQLPQGPLTVPIVEAGIVRRQGTHPWTVSINHRVAGIHRTVEDAAQWLSALTGYPVREILAQVEHLR